MVGAVIRTSVTAAEVDNAVAALYNTLEGSEHPIIAFDLEYINDGGQHPNRIDWIQLAIDADVYLFRIGLPPMGLPASLRTLLMDVNIVKVGAGIAGIVTLYSPTRNTDNKLSQGTIIDCVSGTQLPLVLTWT